MVYREKKKHPYSAITKGTRGIPEERTAGCCCEASIKKRGGGLGVADKKAKKGKPVYRRMFSNKAEGKDEKKLRWLVDWSVEPRMVGGGPQ